MAERFRRFSISGRVVRERYPEAAQVPAVIAEERPCRSCPALRGQACRTLRNTNGGVHPVRRLEAALGSRFLQEMDHLIGIGWPGVKEW